MLYCGLVTADRTAGKQFHLGKEGLACRGHETHCNDCVVFNLHEALLIQALLELYENVGAMKHCRPQTQPASTLQQPPVKVQTLFLWLQWQLLPCWAFMQASRQQQPLLN